MFARVQRNFLRHRWQWNFFVTINKRKFVNFGWIRAIDGEPASITPAFSSVKLHKHCIRHNKTLTDSIGHWHAVISSGFLAQFISRSISELYTTLLFYFFTRETNNYINNIGNSVLLILLWYFVLIIINVTKTPACSIKIRMRNDPLLTRRKQKLDIRGVCRIGKHVTD